LRDSVASVPVRPRWASVRARSANVGSGTARPFGPLFQAGHAALELAIRRVKQRQDLAMSAIVLDAVPLDPLIEQDVRLGDMPDLVAQRLEQNPVGLHPLIERIDAPAQHRQALVQRGHAFL
jgi:hypothetical protein